MHVELRALKPNPLRDFKVDPIDPDNVESLRRSIKEDGFWGGVVARKLKDGTIQIACGHHRVQAAIKAGMKSADIFVLDREAGDDSAMVRIYATENATQRGNTATAATGSVAAAIRHLTKSILTGTSVGTIVPTSQHGVDIVRGQIASSKGLGHETITKFLADVKGCTEKAVRTHLESLKQSGDYARIISEVREEIEKENAEAVRELEAARKAQAKAEAERVKAEAERKAAAERAKAARDEEARKRARREELEAEANAKLAEKRKRELEAEAKNIKGGAAVEAARKADTAAAQRKVTFDFAGVAKHFQNDNQVRVFRDAVTGEGIKHYLPVDQQAKLAKMLVAEANKTGFELSGSYIRETITAMVLRVRAGERKLSRDDMERLRNRDWETKFASAQEDFARNVRGIASAGSEILKLLKQRPKDVPARISGEFKSALKSANNYLDQLNREF